MPTLETIVNESNSVVTKVENSGFFRRYLSRIRRGLRSLAYAAVITVALTGGVRAKAYDKTLESDLNNDGIVDVYDLRIFSKNWLGQGLVDLNKDDIVNFVDFSVMAKQWLMREPWYIKYELENATVIEIIDGDTIKTNNPNIGIIRLLGINTPEENMPYYNEAKNCLKQIENKDIGLLRGSEDTDRYGRKLRYIFYEGKLVNTEILEKGLGICYMIDGLKYEYEFIDAEEFARENQIGLWEKSEDKYANCIELIELNPVDEYFILQNICDFDCDLFGWIVHDNANHIFYLNWLGTGENKKYESKNVWNNDGDRFFMRDSWGKLVIFYEY